MKKCYEFICKGELFAAKLSLALITILIFAAAIARCLRHPIIWAVDASTFLFAWCVFLGGDIALRNDKLFCIVLLTEKLPHKTQLYLKVVNYMIIEVFLAGMIGYGSILSYTTRLRTFQGIPGFSYTWVTISVPIGCLLMLMTVTGKIREVFKMIKEGSTIKKQEGIYEVI